MDKTTLKKKSIKDPQSIKDEAKEDVIVNKKVKAVRKAGIRAYFSSKKNKLVEKLKNFKQLKREEISFVMNFVTYVIMYGALMSVPAVVLFKIPLYQGLTIPALGIMTYIIKEEILTEIHKIISMMKT